VSGAAGGAGGAAGGAGGSEEGKFREIPFTVRVRDSREKEWLSAVQVPCPEERSMAREKDSQARAPVKWATRTKATTRMTATARPAIKMLRLRLEGRGAGWEEVERIGMFWGFSRLWDRYACRRRRS
jgi:hypothetical protein